MAAAHALDGCSPPQHRPRVFRNADKADAPNVAVHPPIAWALALLAGWVLHRLIPLPFIPPAVPTAWLGAMVFALAVALAVWAFASITRAGSNVPTNLPSTTIVDTGPYRFTRNPIYLGMALGLIGEAIGLDTVWPLLTLVPFAVVISYGVIAREEAYLEGKFGDVYRRYRTRVRRWL
ncbi:MAG TPA: isoprenylcysteine carboxylmethyltransferase family protein [Acetobacteraceae bacterium]|nr:isoprenylcysteine carboxylmethyltransferase family protein [Acetobacteraceae bacterium]